MSTALAKADEQASPLVSELANQYGMSPTKFWQTIVDTVMPSSKTPTKEQVAAFLIVAKKYGLDPFTKQIYAYPTSNGIQVVVPIDGWAKLANDQPAYNGCKFTDNLVDGKLHSITCSIFRKDRAEPTQATEYMAECNKGGNVWSKWPARMLRHKAFIQAARLAFSFSGIIDPDEAERFEQTESAASQLKAQIGRNPLKPAITAEVEKGCKDCGREGAHFCTGKPENNGDSKGWNPQDLSFNESSIPNEPKF